MAITTPDNEPLPGQQQPPPRPVEPLAPAPQPNEPMPEQLPVS